jgi:rhodanese-related sulfurtransferase
MTIRILNIAILVVAIVLCGLLVKKYFFQSAQNSAYTIAPNATLSITGISWADSERTVVIALKKECKYCSASAAFYRRLAAQIASQTNTRLIAVFPENESEGEAYLKQLDVPIQQLRYLSFSSLGITSVPALAVFDRNGVVTDMWVGKLSPLKESNVISKLNLEDTRSPDDWSINETDLERKVANNEKLVLLDVRERAAYTANHRNGARNIPLDELPVRAQNELPSEGTIVVYGNDVAEADLACSILDTEGFARVLILVLNPTPVTKQFP